MTDTWERWRGRPSPPASRGPRGGEPDRPQLTVAVGSARPSKLRGVAGGLGRVHPTVPLLIVRADGSEEAVEPRIPSRLAHLRKPIVVLAWPVELQDRGIGVDAEPVGYRETMDAALLRIDYMKREHPGAAVNGLIVVENGRVPIARTADRDPDERLDPIRDMRNDVAVIAIEGRDGRRNVFYSAGTWIPIFVNGAKEATDPVDAARLKRRERDEARRSAQPWSPDDEAQTESGWHVREALGVPHDRSGPSWQSYVGERTPREQLIADAMVRHWDPTLVDPTVHIGPTRGPKRERGGRELGR